MHIEYQVRYQTWFSLFLPGQRTGVRFSEFYTNKAVFFNIVTERIIALFRMAKQQVLALGFVATGVSGTVGTGSEYILCEIHDRIALPRRRTP